MASVSQVDKFRVELTQLNIKSKRQFNEEEFEKLRAKAQELTQTFENIKSKLSQAETVKYSKSLQTVTSKFNPPSPSQRTDLYDASPKAVSPKPAPSSPVLRPELLDESPKSPASSVVESDKKVDDDSETWV